MFGLAMAQLGSEMIGRRHAAHFQEQSASRAFDRQVLLDQTKHQRATADLRAAGLNPILSATQGMGGSAASVSPGSPPGGGSNVDFAGASAKSAQSDLFQAEILKTEAETATAKAQAAYYQAQTADVMQGVEAGLRTGQAGQHFASADQSRQAIETQKQEVAESLERVKRIHQEVKESQARVPTYKSTVELNREQRKVLLEDVRRIQSNVKLTQAQTEQLELLMVQLRKGAMVSASALGDVSAIWQSVGPMLETLSRAQDDGPGLRPPRRWGR